MKTKITLLTLSFISFFSPIELFAQGLINVTGYEIIIPSKAFFTNGLIYIFAIIELSSINENWFDLTGNNIFRGVFRVVKAIRGGIQKVSDTYKNIKE